MAKIFRNFQVDRVASDSSINLDAGHEKSTGYSFVRSPLRLLSRSASRHHTRKKTGASFCEDAAHGDDSQPLGERDSQPFGDQESRLFGERESRPFAELGSRMRDRSRKVTHSAKQAVQDGVSGIRKGLRRITRKGLARQNEDAAGSSASSAGSREGSTPDAQSFREEVMKLDIVQGFTEFLWDSVGGNVEEAFEKEVRQILEKWKDTLDLLISEAWHIAENLCGAQLRKADMLTGQAREAQRKSREAHTAYQKEVTYLRDQVRNLPKAIEEGLQCSYFSPLGQHDDATRDLVLACAEERVKQLFVEADREESCVGLHLANKVSEKSGEIREQMESVFQEERNKFQKERDELRRQVSQLQSEANLLTAAMDESKVDLAGNGKADEELRKSARQSMEEAAELRKLLAQARLEIESMKESMELATQEATDARTMLQAEKRARIATAGKLAQAEQRLEAVPTETVGERATRIEALRERIKASEDADQPNAAKTAALQESVQMNSAESRPILPGATAIDLMEHAVQLHDRLELEKSGGTVVSATDLLTVLEQLGRQLEIEVRQETTNVAPEAFKRSLVLALLVLHAETARGYGSALLPMALLLVKSVGDLCSLAQGTGPHQMKVSALSRQLVDIRSEARRLLSASFVCAQNSFLGLEALRQRLRSSLQAEGRDDAALSLLSSRVSSDDSSRHSDDNFSTARTPHRPAAEIGMAGGNAKNSENTAKGNTCRKSNGLIGLCDLAEPPLKSTLSAVSTPKSSKPGRSCTRLSSDGSMCSTASTGSVHSQGRGSLSSVMPSPKSTTAVPVTPEMSTNVLVTAPSQSAIQQRRQSFSGNRRKSS